MLLVYFPLFYFFYYFLKVFQSFFLIPIFQNQFYYFVLSLSCKRTPVSPHSFKSPDFTSPIFSEQSIFLFCSDSSRSFSNPQSSFKKTLKFKFHYSWKL